MLNCRLLECVTGMKLVRCIEALVRDRRRFTYRHEHKETSVTKSPAG